MWCRWCGNQKCQYYFSQSGRRRKKLQRWQMNKPNFFKMSSNGCKMSFCYRRQMVCPVLLHFPLPLFGVIYGLWLHYCKWVPTSSFKSTRLKMNTQDAYWLTDDDSVNFRMIQNSDFRVQTHVGFCFYSCFKKTTKQNATKTKEEKKKMTHQATTIFSSFP